MGRCQNLSNYKCYFPKEIPREDHGSGYHMEFGKSNTVARVGDRICRREETQNSLCEERGPRRAEIRNRTSKTESRRQEELEV